MVQLELSKDDAVVLRETLESVLKDLSYQIADTDNSEFREQLKKRRDALKNIASMLDSGG